VGTELAERGQAPDPIRPRHPVRNRHVQNASGESDAVAVAIDEVGSPEGVSESRGHPRLVDDMGIDVHHPPRVVRGRPARDRPQQLRRLGQIDRDVENRRGRTGRLGEPVPVASARLAKGIRGHVAVMVTRPPRARARSAAEWRQMPAEPLNPAVKEVSVIIRARDEAGSIGRCLQLVRDQHAAAGAVEVIVVDSGSRDHTAKIALECGARVVAISPRTFSFGGALNLGAANARGEILVALSAHAFPRDRDWLARLVEPFSDPLVACTCGERYGPDGAPLSLPVRQDITLARRHPEWGYSNGAGAFRAALWRARPFRSDLPGCEDKEWALHWLARGQLSIVAPGLAVDHDHTHDSLGSIYRRARREAAGYAAFLELPPYGPRDLVHEWFSDQRWYRSALRARVSHRRAARLLGTYVGRRRGRASARAATRTERV
jgi:rhamnosyltransferase